MSEDAGSVDRGIGLTWDVVRKRSARGTAYCYDCWLFYARFAVPCLRHTLDHERIARGRAIDAVLSP